MNRIAGGTRRRAATIAVIAATIVTIFLASACASRQKKEAKADAVSSASSVAEAPAAGLEALGPIQDAGRTLVVYFTTGNASERVAMDLAGLYSADAERIIEKKPKKWDFMSGGFASSMGMAVEIQTPRFDPAAYDRVFVLTPVWAWRLSPQVRSWLRWAKGRLPQVAYGTISGDTEPDKIVAQMTKEGGRAPFAYAGFSEQDFKVENRGIYLEKLSYLAGLKPRPAK